MAENGKKVPKMAILGQILSILTDIIQIWAYDISIKRSRQNRHVFMVIVPAWPFLILENGRKMTENGHFSS